jgi:hypothetical protein
MNYHSDIRTARAISKIFKIFMIKITTGVAKEVNIRM